LRLVPMRFYINQPILKISFQSLGNSLISDI